MRKIYIIAPALSAVALFLGLFGLTIFSVGLFLGFPFVLFYWLHRTNADIFLRPSGPRDRVCLFALSNRAMISFIAKKVNEKWMKIKDYWIQVQENGEYMFKGKVVSFVRQSDNMNIDKIVNMRQEINYGFFSSDLLLTGQFVKLLLIPIGGIVLLSLAPLPKIIPLIIMAAGPPYALYKVWQSGCLSLAGGQPGSEITVLYIRSSSKLKIARAEAVGQKWWSYKGGTGRVKTTDNTDYTLGKRKVFISSSNCPVTFNLEQAQTANWLRDIGIRDWNEFKKGLELLDNEDQYNDYEMLEEVYEGEKQDLVQKIRNEVKKEKEVKNSAKAK